MRAAAFRAPSIRRWPRRPIPIWSPGGDRLLVLGRRDGTRAGAKEIDWWILPIVMVPRSVRGVFARLDAQHLLRPAMPQVYPAALDWRRRTATIAFC